MHTHALKKALFISLFALISATALSISYPAQSAEMPNFDDGPVITSFGKHAPVSTSSVDENQKFKVAFDVAAGGDAGEINRRFDSLARFINMHAAAGVSAKNIELALVVHGRASIDLLKSESYANVHEQDNPNVALLHALMANGVQVILCGQTASAYEISAQQLVEGVHIELSAMTAHALLQQQGYTVNPF